MCNAMRGGGAYRGVCGNAKCGAEAVRHASVLVLLASSRIGPRSGGERRNIFFLKLSNQIAA
jgi:hypothetical protein